MAAQLQQLVRYTRVQQIVGDVVCMHATGVALGSAITMVGVPVVSACFYRAPSPVAESSESNP